MSVTQTLLDCFMYRQTTVDWGRPNPEARFAPRSRSPTMTEITVLNGLVGGLLATIVMTALMMALGDDSPPPTALFWSEYVGDGEPPEYMMQGMALHLLYGLGAGVALAAVLVVGGFDTLELLEAVAVGLGYGIGMFVVAAGFWMNVVLGIDADPKTAGLFLFFHLAYGGVLGAVLGVGPL
jgi:hypothetical protein